MTIIKAKEFVLRPARLSDAKSIYELQQEYHAKRNFMTVPKNVKEVEKDIKESHFKQNGESFVIDIDGEVVGEISFHMTDKYNKTKATVSYWVSKQCRGKGIATRALKLVTAYAFKKYKLVRIYGHCRTFNTGSARVLEKAGYKLEGILKKDAYKDGKHYDNMLWAKTK